MRPKQLEVLGTELVVVWDDGHESYYALEQLRRNCPCAACSGEPDLFGRVATAPPSQLSIRSFEISSIDRIGNYGLQPTWADGHTWGIWTFDRLRSVCPCAICLKR
jgi:DUF971 family protein